MKKRIGTKIYDTQKGIPVLPELGLYKQSTKMTFYLFDGEKITPIEYNQAAEMIQGAGRIDLLEILGHKSDSKGNSCVKISSQHADKLANYSRVTGRSMKSIIENYIDSLNVGG